MVDLAVITMVKDIVTILGVVGGFTYYVLTVRATQRNQALSLKTQEQALETRQAQLFMHIYDKWSSPENIQMRNEIKTWEWTDFDDYMQKYGRDDNPIEHSKYETIASWFEGIGVLIKRKLIDPALVDDLMSLSSMNVWEKFGPIVYEKRVRFNVPQYYEFWEYLYNEIKEITQDQHPELT